MRKTINVGSTKSVISYILESHKCYEGRKVRILVGKYRLREAIISGMIVDNEHGLLFCCMVLRKGTDEPLNADAETRCYRKVEEFVLVDE